MSVRVSVRTVGKTTSSVAARLFPVWAPTAPAGCVPGPSWRLEFPNGKCQRLRFPDICILAQPAGSVCADVGRSCALKCARCLDASSGFLSAATQLCVAEKLGAGTLGTVLLLLLLGRERTFCSFAPSASAMFMAAATLADRLVARLDATSSGTVARSTSAPCSRRLSHLAAR